MPRTVDHEERRAVILDAFVTVAARAGLHAVSMRSVAAQAGVSLRLVQYYFSSKAGLMLAGLELLERRSNARWTERLADASTTDARSNLRALFAEALPNDEESRVFHLLWMSYAVLAMTDRSLAGEAFVDGPNRLQARIETLLEQGSAEGSLRADLEVRHEAATLLLLLHGAGTAVLIGQQSNETASALLNRRLNALSRSPLSEA